MFVPKNTINIFIFSGGFFIFLFNIGVVQVDFNWNLSQTARADGQSVVDLPVPSAVCPPQFDDQLDGRLNVINFWPPDLNCGGGQPPYVAACGNDILDSGEDCDSALPAACVNSGGYPGTKICHLPSTSSPSGPLCTWQDCQSAEYCGDGLVNGPEACDDGPGGSATCSTLCAVISGGGGSGGGSGSGGGGLPFIGAVNIMASTQCRSAELSWLTTQPSRTWIVYGHASGSYTAEYKGESFFTYHQISLPALEASSTYYYQIKVEEINGQIHLSPEQTFVTPVCPPEPQVLSVKIEAAEAEEDFCSWDWRYLKDGRREPDKDIVNRRDYPNGALLRGCNKPDVYRVENGRGRWIRSWQELHNKYRGQRIYNITDTILKLFLS